MQELITKEQIRAMTDVAEVTALRDEIDRSIHKIEVDLEFPDQDWEWERRAKSALAHHRQMKKVANVHLRRLTGVDTDEASKLLKVQEERRLRKEAALASQAKIVQQAEAQRAAREAKAVIAKAHLLDRLCFTGCFVNVAKKNLDQETFDRLMELALAEHQKRIEVEAA